jgi:methionine-rich copper-binding protein CopC
VKRMVTRGRLGRGASLAAATALAVLTVLLAALVAARGTRAHAELERSSPAAGEVLPAAPAMVEVWFTEEAGAGTTIVVTGPDGQPVDQGDTQVDLYDPERRHVTVSLLPSLGAGLYTVRWQSVSGIDDDAAEGEFVFTVEGAENPCLTAGLDGSPVASPAALGTPVAASACAGLGTPLATGDVELIVTADSGRAGPLVLTVEVRDGAGQPEEGATVVVTAQHQGMDMGRFPHEAVAAGPGRYVAERVGMGMGGAWLVEVTVDRPGQARVVGYVVVVLEGLS